MAIWRSEIEEVQRRLPAILKQANRGEPCVVTKQGRDYAAIVPPNYLEGRKGGPSLLPLRGSGKGLWGRASNCATARTREEWD